ncbi:hypothetical protein Taro_048165 [Colocasia esculenta]|uniref:glucan endo-1,3-beta-D-glucosidase n=1 Tax=Colocasia esculenta TaxID=4460 RepID=A0A843WV18_COLES|nr:hypothetical protein [Colocasia esculenta]
MPTKKRSSSSHGTPPFLFPETHSSVLPDPSNFFSAHLLSSPLPTNSFFQNFVLKNGDLPEYVHPYLIKSSSSSLNISYPSRFCSPNYISQIFTPDLTISSLNDTRISRHEISSFDDLSVTLDLPPALRFFLVRGSPFITCSAIDPQISTSLSVSSCHAIKSVDSDHTCTKYSFHLDNGQTYLCYCTSPLQLTRSSPTEFHSVPAFNGVLRFACLPSPSCEALLDLFRSCYPVSGRAAFASPFCLEYIWETRGRGELLLLAHPLHLRLLSRVEGAVSAVLSDVKYKSIDGDLVGVVGDSWVLRTKPIRMTWYSFHGVSTDGYEEIAAALRKDVTCLDSTPILTPSSYFYGKAIGRAARLALIAEEISLAEVIPAVVRFLKGSVEPWLEGTFAGNAFLYDPKWGGIVTKLGAEGPNADFGFGVHNDHHYHLGYFLYAIAVLTKLDPAWGRRYKPQAYALATDFMSLAEDPHPRYTRLRCFDLWKLHSWAGGLTEFADGRNQESSSESVNAYYAAALMGLSYGDPELTAVGSTLAALEIQAARTWWHVREEDGTYDAEFSRENRVLGILWANKRDSGLWFAPAEWRECRVGIHVLPLLPITEALFQDIGFVKALVGWVASALKREGVGEGWKGFAYAMEGMLDKKAALEETRRLAGFDDGNSLSNMLWWHHSRVVEGEEEGPGEWGMGICFGDYCK